MLSTTILVVLIYVTRSKISALAKFRKTFLYDNFLLLIVLVYYVFLQLFSLIKFTTRMFVSVAFFFVRDFRFPPSGVSRQSPTAISIWQHCVLVRWTNPTQQNVTYERNVVRCSAQIKISQILVLIPPHVHYIMLGNYIRKHNGAPARLAPQSRCNRTSWRPATARETRKLPSAPVIRRVRKFPLLPGGNEIHRRN